jgi:hypothetical protein
MEPLMRTKHSVSRYRVSTPVVPFAARSDREWLAFVVADSLRFGWTFGGLRFVRVEFIDV